MKKKLFLILVIILFPTLQISAQDEYVGTIASAQLSNIEEGEVTNIELYFVPSLDSDGRMSTVNYIESLVIDLTSNSLTIGNTFAYTNVAVAYGDSSNCSTAVFTGQTIVSGVSIGTGTVGVSISGQNIIFSYTASDYEKDICHRITINSVDSNNGISVDSLAGHVSETISASTASFGDNVEIFEAPIVLLDDGTDQDNSQLSINLSVAGVISFDVDVESAACTAGTETTFMDNKVDFGRLTPTLVARSGVNSVNYICLDLQTNALNGASVYVQSDRNNAVAGLVNGLDVIQSMTGDLNLPGNPVGYGLRVVGIGTVTGSNPGVPSSPFNSVTPGNIGIIPGLLGVPSELLSTGGVFSTDANDRIVIEAATKIDYSFASGNYEDTIYFTAVAEF